MDLSFHKYLHGSSAMHSEYGVVPLSISIIQHGFHDPLLKKFLGEWYLPVSIIRYDGGNGDKLDWFFSRVFFQGIQEYILEKIQQDTQLVAEIIHYSLIHGESARRLARMTYDEAMGKTLQNRKIANHLRPLVAEMQKLCAYGFLAVMSDLYYLGFSKLLEVVVGKHMRQQKIDKSPKEFVSILISPTELTRAFAYKQRLYQCAQDLDGAPTDSFGRSPCVQKIVRDFYAIHYGHRGPVLSKQEVANEIKEILAKGEVKTACQQVSHERELLIKRQTDIMQKLQFTQAEERLLAAARQFIYIKAFRLEVLFEVNAAIDAMLGQVAKRLNRELMELKYMSFTELLAYLEKGKALPDANIMAARRAFMTYTAIQTDGVEIRVGNEARKHLDQFLEAAQDIGERFSVHGSVACSGRVTGKVKIVNTKADLNKVEEGDILVAVQTTPELLPAMKKAVAFVTDVGGITSHAAIVSREMNKPCIIGTKFATEVFKDGDLVEVDALNGYVRKVK